jgi:tripartite-type tricarboxylate transporter receptor subunit TctC
LTRRANHRHKFIIAKIVKRPRGEIRRGLFHWTFESDGGRTSRRHILPRTLPERRKRAAVRAFGKRKRFAGTRERAGPRRGTRPPPHAAPRVEGYTIGGFNDSIMTMVPHLQSKMRWDILKDFEPVSLAATVEWGLIAGNQTNFKSAADLIAAAKAAPGKIDYSSGGPGSPQHLAMAMFASAAGISLTHVPYKGATQAATDVASGQIPVGFQGLGTVAALVRGGQLRLIGVTTEKRLPQFPDVATVSESGLPGFFFNSWFAILAPAGTPKEIVNRLNAEVLKALGDTEVRRKLEELGFAVRGSSAEDLRVMTRDQLAKYARVIKEMGIASE